MTTQKRIIDSEIIALDDIEDVTDVTEITDVTDVATVQELLREKLEQVAQELQDSAYDSKSLGKLGESYATLRLMQRGWHVLDTNWHAHHGELDIVMLTPEQTVVFVEVKTRRTTQYGTPLEAITRQKRSKLRETGMQWIKEFGKNIPHYRIRFDAVSILIINKHTYPDSAYELQAREEIENNQPIQFIHVPGAF